MKKDIGIMKKTAYVIVFLLAVLTVQASVLLDNFESYSVGTITSPWVITDGTPTVGQETDGNQYLQSYGSYLALGDYSIVNLDTETTVFFRVYDGGGTNPDVSVGLSNTATPTSTWNDFEAYVVLVNGNLAARNGTNGNIAIISGITEMTWYNVWLVINNSTNTYDVYVTTGSSDATASDQKADDYSFRNGGTSDLSSFKVYGRSYGTVQVDDIYIVPGMDLTIPSPGPMPAVIVSSPANAAVSETQSASFTTLFTSETTPTVQWFKVDADGDIELTSADDITTDLSYDSTAQQYTAVLTISNITMLDRGQYYCQVNNESDYLRSSDTAILTVYGLVAHWTLDQDDFVSGQYVDIVSGYGAAAQGTPTFVAGADESDNGAIQVDADNGWATIDGFDPGSTGAMTVCIWVNWQETSVTSDDLTATALPDDTTITAADGLKAENKWQQVSAVFDGTTGKIYINGKMIAQGNCSLPEDMTSLLSIGCTRSGSESFNGYLDDLRIYNYAMTDMQVADVYHVMNGDSVCLLDYASQYDYSGPDGQPDCIVDIYDLRVFANSWLVLYDYAEFSDLAGNWLSTGLYPGCNQE